MTTELVVMATAARTALVGYWALVKSVQLCAAAADAPDTKLTHN